MYDPVNRIASFDQMKGVAIILVVMGHVNHFSFGLNNSQFGHFISIFHMPIFFFISAYLAYKVFPDTISMLRKLCNRSLMLLIPYLVFSGTYCLFKGFSFPNLLS